MIRRPLPPGTDIMWRPALERWATYYDELTDEERLAVQDECQEAKARYAKIIAEERE